MFAPFSEYKHTANMNPGGSEPMTLGSPASSPTNPSMAGGVSYLPPYLIGSNTCDISQKSGPIWNSPGKRYPNSATSPFTSTAASPVSHSSNPRKNLYQSQSSSLMNHSATEKPGGPPVRGLFDSVASPSVSALDRSQHNVTFGTPVTPGMQQLNGILTPSRSFSQNNTSFVSPAQIDPFYTQGEAISLGEQLDETWITVFGFPPAAASYIVQQFSQYGTIIEHKIAPAGNWIHIHYEAKLQAKKALSKNGKVFGGSIMVGVKPCIELNIMNESGKENSDLNTSVSSVNSSNFEQKKKHGNIRPLTQAYRTAMSDHEVTPNSRTPQKSNGFVTKTMEYLLGW